MEMTALKNNADFTLDIAKKFAYIDKIYCQYIYQISEMMWCTNLKSVDHQVISSTAKLVQMPSKGQ